jgi:hypothetical protein
MLLGAVAVLASLLAGCPAVCCLRSWMWTWRLMMHQQQQQQQQASSSNSSLGSSSSRAETALQLCSRTSSGPRLARQVQQRQASLRVHAAAALGGSLGAGRRSCRCPRLLLNLAGGLAVQVEVLLLLLLGAAHQHTWPRCPLVLLWALLLLGRVPALLRPGTAMQSTRLWHWRRCSTTCPH